MRMTSSALAVGILATTLAACASSPNPRSGAAAGQPGAAAAISSASAPSTTPGSSAATSSETSGQATTPAPPVSRPTPTGKPSPTPTSHRSTPSPSGSKGASTATSSTNRTTLPGTVPTSFGYDPAADSKAQIDAARAAAKGDGREVLLDFGASWCGNCVQMDRAFHDSSVQAVLASSYHLVQVDVDASGSMGLLSQYAPSNSSGYGLPVLVILSSSGATRVDTDKSGNPGFDTSSFLAFLKKWAG